MCRSVSSATVSADAKAALPKLLLVDDEEAIQKILKSVLEREGYEVWTAPNGKAAQDLVGYLDFKAVISDIKMPGVSGLDLLKFIRETHPKMPVILMTGFSKIMETKEALELGANGFLAKPFKREELVKAIHDACSDEEVPPLPDAAYSDESFCKVGIDQFISGKDMSFEIFLKLGEQHFTKIAHRGEDVDELRIKELKSKKVEFLYIKSGDFAKYVGFNLTLTKAANKSNAIPHAKKFQLAKHANAVIMENLCVNGVNPESFSQAKDITESTLSLLSECPESFDILASLAACGDPLYTHSLGVSLFSALIAKQVGWNAPSTLFKVSTAGMLHDIGMKEIDPAIAEKPRSALSIAEIKLLESHPARAVEILTSIPSLSSDILQIILHHHEAVDGRGYPSRLTRQKINLISRLVSVADRFCEIALAGSNSPGLPAHEAFDRLNMIYNETLDPLFVAALKVVLGIDKKAE